MNEGTRSLALVKAAGLILMAALHTGCAETTNSALIEVTREDWSFGDAPGRKLTTEHFEIYSTVTDVEFEDALPAFLEAAHAQYEALLPPSSDAGPMQTYVLNNREQWERMARERFPARFPIYRQMSAGGFAEGNVCVAYYLVQRAYTLSVLAHEGMHQYFAHHFKTPLPAWVNEGLACYCESYDLPGGVPRFTPTNNTFRINFLREALAVGSIIDIREMLSTDAGKVIVGGESRAVKTYYAQAWALVVYLRHGADGRYAGGFDRMLADIAAGEIEVQARAAKIRAPSPQQTSYGEAVFRAYISEDLAGFERDFETYLFKLAGFRPPAVQKGEASSPGDRRSSAGNP